MAYVDVNTAAYGGISAAPTGGGLPAANAVPPSGQSGSGGPGANYSSKTWALTYLGLIVAILVITGVLFNGKGRK